jgi:DNA-binding response OmpR family regulator
VLAPKGELLAHIVTELALLGYRPTIMEGDGPTDAGEPADVAVIAAPDGLEEVLQPARSLRGGARAIPLLWLVRPQDLGALHEHEHLIDDFIGMPLHPGELAMRMRLLRRRTHSSDEETIRRGPLAINLVTYQVTLEHRPLDLTFMEYELMKLFMSHSGRVYTREEILTRVWGYDYFGGMRTVDVHVRRLRAKLGQDHAWLIETVRSVGYRLAQVRA